MPPPPSDDVSKLVDASIYSVNLPPCATKDDRIRLANDLRAMGKTFGTVSRCLVHESKQGPKGHTSANIHFTRADPALKFKMFLNKKKIKDCIVEARWNGITEYASPEVSKPAMSYAKVTSSYAKVTSSYAKLTPSQVSAPKEKKLVEMDDDGYQMKTGKRGKAKKITVSAISETFEKLHDQKVDQKVEEEKIPIDPFPPLPMISHEKKESDNDHDIDAEDDELLLEDNEATEKLKHSSSTRKHKQNLIRTPTGTQSWANRLFSSPDCVMHAFDDQERRIAPDGNTYTKSEFFDYFDSLHQWNKALKIVPQMLLESAKPATVDADIKCFQESDEESDEESDVELDLFSDENDIDEDEMSMWMLKNAQLLVRH